jgi:hypothetical protein
VAAALGEGLVLDLHGGHARPLEGAHGAAGVERVAVAGVDQRPLAPQQRAQVGAWRWHLGPSVLLGRERCRAWPGWLHQPGPRTGEPLLKNRFGSLSGRAIKPIGLRVVAELRDAGLRVPIIATAGIRTFDDCREFLWAGADAVSLGSEAWLAPLPGYALGPARGAAFGA